MLGVDHIDASQYYGPDVVNDLIRDTLYPYAEGLRLVTKVGWRRDGAGGIFPAQAPAELRDGVEANLRSLRVERLDLVNLRLPGGADLAAVSLDDQLGTLEDLRREGKIDLIGLSNVDRATVERALELVDVAGTQNAYIAFVPLGPLGSAYRQGPARLAADAAIAEVAAKHGSTASQIALAWLLARYERMLLIPGTSSLHSVVNRDRCNGLPCIPSLAQWTPRQR